MPRKDYIEIHTDILDRPEIMDLPADLFCTWFEVLLCVHLFGHESDDHIDVPRAAYVLHRSEETLRTALRGLVARGLVDSVRDGFHISLLGRAICRAKPMTAAERMRAYRARLKAAGGADALRSRNAGRNASRNARYEPLRGSRNGPIKEERKQEPIRIEAGTTVPSLPAPLSSSQTLSVSPKKAQPTAGLRLLPPSEQPELRLVAPPVAEEVAPGGRYPEGFEDLWAEYRNYGNPNSSKADAFKRWAKLSAAEKRLAFDGLTGGYLVWLIGERKRKPDYPAQHLSTFLSRRGWEPFLEKRASG